MPRPGRRRLRQHQQRSRGARHDAGRHPEHAGVVACRGPPGPWPAPGGRHARPAVRLCRAPPEAKPDSRGGRPGPRLCPDELWKAGPPRSQAGRARRPSVADARFQLGPSRDSSVRRSPPTGPAPGRLSSGHANARPPARAKCAPALKLAPATRVVLASAAPANGSSAQGAFASVPVLEQGRAYRRRGVWSARPLTASTMSGDKPPTRCIEVRCPGLAFWTKNQFISDCDRDTAHQATHSHLLTPCRGSWLRDTRPPSLCSTGFCRVTTVRRRKSSTGCAGEATAGPVACP